MNPTDSPQGTDVDTRLDGGNAGQRPPIDPLRRVFIPVERRTPNGTTVFRTLDHEVYARMADGSIRRAHPKVHGKAARHADKLARRKG